MDHVLLRIGVVLMIVSVLPWLTLLVLPFLGLSGGDTAAAVGALLVAAEILFWLGVVLAGRDTWRLARSQGWRRVPGGLWRVLRYGEVRGRG